LRSP